MQRIIAQLFPNNEIRVRLAASPPPKDLFQSVNTASSDGGFLVSQSQNETQPENGSESASTSLLDISSKLRTLDSANLPPGFGGSPKRTNFGLNARRTILRCGGVIDVDNEPKESLFLTGTLPGSTTEAMEEMCNWSSYFVDRLKSWIAKHAQNTFSMYTWELQKRGALHLHYVVVIEDEKARDYIRCEFKNQWYRLLENVTSKTGIDMFRRYDGSTWRNAKDALQAYAVECKKSVASYISKYISKHESERNKQYFPVRWWGCSRPLLAKLRALTVTIEIDKLKRGKAFAMYEDCQSILESVATVSYHYRDRFGQGLNTAAYIPKKWIENAWNTLSSRISPMMHNSENVIGGNLQSLRKLLIELQQCSRNWKNLKQNLSGISLAVIEKLNHSQSPTLTEVVALMNELLSLLSFDLSNGQRYPEAVTRWVSMMMSRKLSIQASGNPSPVTSLTKCSSTSCREQSQTIPIATYEQLSLLPERSTPPRNE